MKIFRRFASKVEPRAALEENREAWDQAWSSMPHRRLESRTGGVADDSLVRDWGDVTSATLSLAPSVYTELVERESQTCPVCGASTTDSERLAASMNVRFADGRSVGICVWVHRSCFE